MNVTILFGTETGNAKQLAARTGQALVEDQHQARAYQMDKVPPDQINRIGCLLIITSTHGEGEPPENARPLWQFLKDSDLDMSRTYYSVCGLGDSDYEHFCQCGRDFDQMLSSHGAKRFFPMAECDAEFEFTFGHWLKGIRQKLAGR